LLTKQARILTTISCVGFLLLFLSCNKPNNKNEGHEKVDIKLGKAEISEGMEKLLDRIFELWYPLSLDTVYGGYLSDLNYKWEVSGGQNKMIVTQSRHVWAISNAALSFPKYNKYRYAAEHGFKFLKDVMWDDEYGGFYNLVDREGNVLGNNGQIVKEAYGNAFAIYGLSAYYNLTKDPNALELAKKAFDWLGKNSYDPKFGGYYQYLHRDGKPFTEGYNGTPPKDQNSSIHLLESFTELYKVYPDPLVKEKLNELLVLIRDTITTDKGYMNLFFSKKWEHVSFGSRGREAVEANYDFDHVSFGHDVETAYLLMEASDILGIEDNSKTLAVGKKMTDHALANGLDKSVGGLFDGGYYFEDSKCSIIRNTKEWWAQVEAMNTFLIMSQLYPEDENSYYDKFTLMWEYCNKYLIDHKHGGWFWGGIDIVPGNVDLPKGTIWKGDYHTSRSLINCIKRLKGVESD
jgi:mannobiose 2-epimerase